MGTASLALLLALSLSRVEGQPSLPPLDDVWRFPRASVCRIWVEAGQRESFIVWEIYRKLPRPADQLFRDYAVRIDRITNSWDELAHAWDESLPEARRRWHLEQLRLLIGDAQYFCGYIPPPLELEFFYLGDEL